MIWLSEFFMAPEPVDERRAPVGDPTPNPLPDGAPVIDDPSRETPAIDPGRRDAPQPIRDPGRDPLSEPTPH